MTGIKTVVLKVGIFLVAFHATSAFAASVWFVDKANSSPAPDGSSWQKAFPTIQQAIDIAVVGGGGQVWVRAGVYDEQRSSASGALVLAPGIELFGGFDGVESTLGERDPIANLTIISGATARGGQAAFHVILGADDAVIDGFTITGGNATGLNLDGKGGGILNDGASPTVSNCTFAGNAAKTGGAAANIGGSPVFQNCRFDDNTAHEFGGAVSSEGGELTVTNCRFDGNGATTAVGGAIANRTNVSGSISGCTFVENAAVLGGAIYNEAISNAVPLAIAASAFLQNAAIGPSGQGGAIYNKSAISVEISDCTVTSNTAASGGGVFSLDSSAAFTGCVLSSNEADTGGGAVNSNSTGLFTNCRFESNAASGTNGGGVLNQSSNPEFDGCTFIDNTAQRGGGVFNEASNAIFSDCKFSGNTADLSGGAVQNDVGSLPTLIDSIFDLNQVIDNTTVTGHGGGAISNTGDSSPYISMCTFSHNSAGQGGALYDNNAGIVVVDACRFFDNEATLGGAIALDDSLSIFQNCILARNISTGSGGAIAIGPNQSGTFANCTLWKNSASVSGGGFRFASGAKTIISNCIVRENTPDQIVSVAKALRVDHCDISGGFAGIGNIDSDPLFVFSQGDDFRLRAGSPVIDAGSDTNSPSFDALGFPRPLGAAVDIGAFEFPPDDVDGDGLPDGYEGSGDADNDGTSNIGDPDADNDGIPDGAEYLNSLDPLNGADAAEDPDGDGLTSLSEVQTHGTHPRLTDTEGDGMPDGFEVNNDLDPFAADANKDPDSDGLTNLREYILGSDPHDPGDPINEVYVDPSGSDETGDGTIGNPFQTIGHALIVAAPDGIDFHLVYIMVGDGIYDEQLVLPPYMWVVGAGQDSTTIRFFDSNASRRTVVIGGEGAGIQNCTLTFPQEASGANSLIEIFDVSMDVGDVLLDGQGLPDSTGVFVSGVASSDAVIHDCTFTNLGVGISGFDSMAGVGRNLFDAINGDAIQTIGGDKRVGGTASLTIGRRNRTTVSGLNRFRAIGGLCVNNIGADPVSAELNDWGVYTDDAIAQRVSGLANFTPFLSEAMRPDTVLIDVVDLVTGEPIPNGQAARTVLYPGAISAVRDETTGLFYLRDAPTGAYTLFASAIEYIEESRDIVVDAIQINTLVYALESLFHAGDIDGSGMVDSVDVQYVINQALGIETGLDETDIDNSGEVDSTDVQLVINAALL